MTPDTLPASYAIIKDQASRASDFANLAGAGATPGKTRYLTAVRDVPGSVIVIVPCVMTKFVVGQKSPRQVNIQSPAGGKDSSQAG